MENLHCINQRAVPRRKKVTLDFRVLLIYMLPRNNANNCTEAAQRKREKASRVGETSEPRHREQNFNTTFFSQDYNVTLHIYIFRYHGALLPGHTKERRPKEMHFIPTRLIINIAKRRSRSRSLKRPTRPDNHFSRTR